MTTLTKTRAQFNARTAVLWTAQILTAGMFFLAGSSKLTGDPAMVGAFDVIGIGQWFRYVTGAIEVASAALLLVPSLAVFGAAALAVTMVGAIASHLFILGGSALVPLVLLVVTSAIAWFRWSER